MVSKNPLISIIILNYNSGDFLTNCVDSIKNSNFENFEIIIVDNGSTDESLENCKTKFNDLNFIENEKNLGYCEGNNIGINRAKGDFIVILNPDTIVQQNWLKELLSAFEVNGEGLYQPKLLFLNDKTKINSAGNMIQIFGFGFSRGHGEVDEGQYDSFEQIGFASGACLFTSRKVIEKIGRFEPFLFAYNEDMDLGWRALKLGIKSFYVPKSVVYHFGSLVEKWSSQKWFLLERNRLYCIRTHYSDISQRKMKWPFFMIEFTLFFYFLSKGMLRPKIRAYQSLKKNQKLILEKHLELENSRKITDEKIIEHFVDEIYTPKEVSKKSTNKLFNKLLRFYASQFRSRISNHE